MSDVSITQIKNLIRSYRKATWCCIWRDALGIHIIDHYWNARIVGDLKWARYKGWR